jgi:tRNA-2-methylthio-N6-dimethylallyladenosine synthase
MRRGRGVRSSRRRSDEMKFYIETYGCQMNEYDSRMIASILEEAGHVAARGLDEADAVVVNTCSVRERAERRVLGRLRHLRGLARGGAILGVVGCVAQRMRGELMRSVGGLDFVVGTDQYGRLPAILEAAEGDSRTVATEADATQSYDRRPPATEASLLEFVSVMRGCDNYCSYCIVPYVRGRERSRPLAGVVEEVTRLVELGTRDVTLIGQNVNSYRDGDARFDDLLRRVARVPGLLRVRFATSHPKDLSDGLIAAVSEVEEVCEHVHLPVQSGSDDVLSAMNRSYSRSQYLDLVGRIREGIPGVSLTTDVIVGFPGESEAMFEETVSLMEEVRFDSAFMFRYSVREGTAAAGLEDDVPEDIKISRLKHVISLQQRTTQAINGELVGETLEVLVEGRSEKNEDLLFGRTRTAKAVVFPGRPELTGNLVDVPIRSASAWTLHGDGAGDT